MTTRVAEQWIASRSWQSVALVPPLPIDAVPTPALMLDEAALQRNIAAMSTHLSSHGKRARPHAKTHKCPLVARRQLDAGAVGICVAKISEGWAMAKAGIGPLLVTSPLATAEKAESLARLAAVSNGLTTVVDSELGVERLAEACRAVGTTVDVLIDLDPVMGRTGVREPERVYALAERLRAAGLRLVGVQHYAGHVMHLSGFAERRAKSVSLWDRAAEIWHGLEERGFSVDVVTGGGTGTFDIDCDVPEITDLQVGSYIFMDRQYADIGGRSGPVFAPFETSLTVAATAISQPHPAAVTLDCGYKGMASDAGSPIVRELDGAQFRFGGDEHGIVVLPKGYQEPVLGKRFSLFVSHCDPTVNLYDYYWVHRDGMVHELWPITARGASW